MTGMPFAGKTQGANYTVRLGGLCIYIAPVVISISIAEDALSLGSMPVGDSVVSAVPITVVNDGSGINETYSLFLTNPAGWTASQANAGMETYILNAVFDADGAGIGWDNTNHALLTIPSLCTSTKFAGDQTGVNVPYNATRKLWFQFKSPTTTSVTTEQAVTVTVTAQAS